MDNLNQEEEEETQENETVDETNVQESESNQEENTDTQENTQSQKQSNNENTPGGLTPNLFTDMAKEMEKTFDLKGNEETPLTADGKPDIGKAFQNMMSGDNPKKLMKMVSKFSAKIQKDITSGRMNEQDLLRQTSQMMGGTDVEKMAEEMMKNPKMKNKYETSMRNQNARERLRKKLEDRKKNSDE